MTPTLPRKRLGLAALAVLAGALVWTELQASGSTRDADLILLPFVPNEVRVPCRVGARLLVYDPRADEPEAELVALRVFSGEDLLHERALDARLAGDPLYGRIQEKIERLPPEVTELHRERRYFAEPEAPEYAGLEVAERHAEVREELAELRARLAGGAPPSFVELPFPLDLDQLFYADDAPGTRRALRLAVTYRRGGELREATVTEDVRLLAPPPASRTLELGSGTVTIHAGDLHVHSCHGEAVNACAPSQDCAAESLQTSGSFTYSELRTQYEALGLDWFTATDHSYCINDTAEYLTIAAECAALTDSTFVVIPDTELSSDEAGPQTGSDSANLLCLFGEPQNHMGAHGISSRVPGGDDGFLGFCDGIASDALAPFPDNVATIRAQGGYPIVNHATAGAFAWNSFAATTGIEAGGMHGVEIWNGAFVAGQGGDVGRWVDWLLAGRILYAYSGSDTHDEAFAFGANHAVFADEPFTPDGLEEVLKQGRVYVSNGPLALLEVELAGLPVLMGTRYQLPTGAPAAPLTVRLSYDLGTDPGRISIFRGRVGDAAEALLCQSASLTGSGVFECADTLETAARSWYRAYVESDDGTQVAYTNPVFFLVGGDDPFVYCAAKPNSLGCVPEIAFSGVPSATNPAPFEVSASEVLNQANGVLFYGLSPALVPFQDGTRCVGAPIVRTPIQNSGGSLPPLDCSGVFSLDFNAWIQSAVDPSLQPGVTVYAQYWYRDPQSASTTGLSDALQFTIGP